MSTIHSTDPAVAGYVAAVRAALADLPTEECDELCEDLEQHLTEVAAEADGPLTARLGSPESYAAELRIAAGLAATAPPTRQGLYRRLRALDRRAVARVRDAVAALRGGDGPLVSVLRDLRPAWWATRGYLVVLGLGILIDPHTALGWFPLPSLGGPILGLLLAVGATVASWRLGPTSGTSTARRRLGVAASVLTTGVLLLAVAQIRDLGSDLSWWRQSAYEAWGEQQGLFTERPQGLMTSDGRQVINLFPFGPDGEPLEQVLLYDQDGNPVELQIEHSSEGWPVVTSYPLSAEGRPLLHVFPQRQALRTGDPEAQSSTPFGRRPAVEVPLLEQTTPARDERQTRSMPAEDEAADDGHDTAEAPASAADATDAPGS
jgi:hypothetical protein